MEDYKKDAKVFDIYVDITNTVCFRAKSNCPHFLKEWLQRQLAPILKTQPTGARIHIEVGDYYRGEEEYEAEVYGDIENGYTVFEQVKEELFGEKPC